MPERVTVGEEKVSVTITRKTTGDLIVSQHSAERWFVSPSAAMKALRQMIEAFTEYPIDGEKVEVDRDGADAALARDVADER